MFDLPLALAFAGGLVATVNPCGFAMLPAYLSFFLSLDGDTDRTGPEAVLRGLHVGLMVSVGFLVVFGLAGAVLSAGAQAVVDAMPWVALVVGVGVAGLGVWLLAGRSLPLRVPGPQRGVEGRRLPALVGFGVAYALASLSCTLPVFLAVVAGTLTRDSVPAGLAVFGVYAVGMTLPLLGLSVALALGRGMVARRLRSLSRHVNRVAGGLMIVAGAYIVLFWTVSLGGTGDAAAPQAAVGVVETWSSRLTTSLGSRPLVTGAVLALIVALAVLRARSARR